MGLFSNFPYTNFHEMNLDWMLQELKKLVNEWDSFGGTVSASAHTSADPEVSVEGDLKTGLSFNFGLVQGPRGLTGPQGPAGPEGPQGAGLQILGTYPTLSALQTAHPTGTAGDIYLVGSGGSYTLYVWNEDTSSWADGGSLTSPTPSNTAPVMDGTASAGSSSLYARGDHVHPKDSTKLDLSNTDGVYAVENGVQVMLDVSDSSSADALVRYDSVGDLHTRNLSATGDISADDVNASGDVNATDITASGTVSANSLNITTDPVLNSDLLKAEIQNANGYRPLGRVGGVDPLNLIYDINNIPSIRLSAVDYNSSGQVTALSDEVAFTDEFTINSQDYAETRIALRPATASKLGGVKAGTGLNITSDGTLSVASSSGFTVDLLWSNASPTSSFSSQTVSIDLSSYKMVYVVFRFASAAFHIPALTAIDDLTYRITSIGTAATYSGSYRTMTPTITGISFGAGTTNGSTSNDHMIPEFIYGLK